MGALIDFLLENFVYVVFIAIILILALIGYIVDKTKTNNLKKELLKADEDAIGDIPIANIGANVTLGETVNKMATVTNGNVNKENTPIPALKVETPPKE